MSKSGPKSKNGTTSKKIVDKSQIWIKIQEMNQNPRNGSKSVNGSKSKK